MVKSYAQYHLQEFKDYHIDEINTFSAPIKDESTHRRLVTLVSVKIEPVIKLCYIRQWSALFSTLN